MKKIFFICGCMLGLVSISYSQTLFTYGPHKVNTDEFLRAYSKNNATEPNKEKALKDYVQLYINFKLKVLDAKQHGLDSLPQLKKDVADFRSQVIEGYLANPEAIEKLEKEAFERSKKDLLVQHFYIPFSKNAPTETKALAAKAGDYLISHLAKGNTNYTKLAEEASQKFTAVSTTNLGYITAFSLPYAYENIVYALPLHGISKPYTTEKGIHVFKLVNSRASMGRWRVAQILFSFPPQADEINKAQVKKKADSVYLLLKNGMNFGEAVKNFSTDRLTLNSDGELPEFGTAKYSASFQNPVFQLQQVGDFTQPFQTSLGYHIVKKIRQQNISDSMTNAVFRLEIKQKVLADKRMDKVKEAFAKEVLALTNFKSSNKISQTDLYAFVDRIKNLTPVQVTPNYSNPTLVIGHFLKEDVLAESWFAFVRGFVNNPEVYHKQSPAQIWDAFVLEKSEEYYRQHLEDFSPAFQYQMQEFKEGNMLFEIMEREVWNKAITDSVGARALYEANKQNYKWNKSADVIVFNSSNKNIAEEAIKKLSNHKTWKQIILESDGLVQADSARYELNQMAIADSNFVIKAGAITPLIVGDDGTALFVKFIKLYEANEPRSFEDARGLVVNDYQAVLEKQWLEQLKKQFPVRINKKQLQKLLRSQR